MADGALVLELIKDKARSPAHAAVSASGMETMSSPLRRAAAHLMVAGPGPERRRAKLQGAHLSTRARVQDSESPYAKGNGVALISNEGQRKSTKVAEIEMQKDQGPKDL